MKNPIVIERIGGESEAIGAGPLRRAFQRIRLSLRITSSVEKIAARNRVERLFEVNFRSPWNR